MGCSTFRQPDTNVPRWHLPGALQEHSAGDLEAAFSSTAAAKVRGEGLVGALQNARFFRHQGPSPISQAGSKPHQPPAERTQSGTQVLAVHGVFVTIFSSTSQQWLMIGALRTARRALPQRIHHGHPCRAIAIEGRPRAGCADSPRSLQDCPLARAGERVAMVL